MVETNEIQLEVINADTKQLLSKVMVSANGLPALFYPGQIVTIFDTSWEVEKAEPASSWEFIDRGSLRLLVRVPVPVHEVTPILHHVPTIADSVPPLASGTSKAGKSVLELDEDDWRQVEFVSYDQKKSVEVCLAQIKTIYAQETERRGFSRVHVRSEMSEPLYGVNIRAAEVYDIFGASALPFTGLAFSRFSGLISGGFALETNTEITIYGQQDKGIVKALCMGATEPTGRFRAHVEALATFAIFHRLCLVDWVNTTLVPPDMDEFRRHFG